MGTDGNGHQTKNASTSYPVMPWRTGLGGGCRVRGTDDIRNMNLVCNLAGARQPLVSPKVEQPQRRDLYADLTAGRIQYRSGVGG